MTETAKRADVVLPAASFAEGDGTYTNLERRVQRAPQGIRAAGDSRPDWMILAALADRWLAAQAEPHPSDGEEKASGASGSGTSAVSGAAPRRWIGKERHARPGKVQRRSRGTTPTLKPCWMKSAKRRLFTQASTGTPSENPACSGVRRPRRSPRAESR